MAGRTFGFYLGRTIQSKGDLFPPRLALPLAFPPAGQKVLLRLTERRSLLVSVSTDTLGASGQNRRHRQIPQLPRR